MRTYRKQLDLILIIVLTYITIATCGNTPEDAYLFQDRKTNPSRYIISSSICISSNTNSNISISTRTTFNTRSFNDTPSSTRSYTPPPTQSPTPPPIPALTWPSTQSPTPSPVNNIPNTMDALDISKGIYVLSLQDTEKQKDLNTIKRYLTDLLNPSSFVVAENPNRMQAATNDNNCFSEPTVPDVVLSPRRWSSPPSNCSSLGTAVGSEPEGYIRSIDSNRSNTLNSPFSNQIDTYSPNSNRQIPSPPNTNQQQSYQMPNSGRTITRTEFNMFVSCSLKKEYSTESNRKKRPSSPQYEEPKKKRYTPSTT
ncbi:hypothetical protein NEOKW01_0473 [Nematocida sp. AWRm80]|nr:hypothetical protein NEOKW01_0473 [Nematocida sp. AWRm80]